jgi:hypothetical protein
MWKLFNILYEKYAAEGTLKPLIGLGMKIHIPQTPMDTILKHSHPILISAIEDWFYSSLSTYICMLYINT